MNFAIVEQNGILYVGAKSQKQVIYNTGSCIVASDCQSKGFLQALKRQKHPDALADKISRSLQRSNTKTTVSGRNRARLESITIASGKKKLESHSLCLEDLVSCNQFGFITSKANKALYNPSITLTLPPSEYSGLLEITRESKRRINAQVFSLFTDLLNHGDERLVKRLVTSYVNYEHGLINNLDFQRELNKIERKYKNHPNIFIRTFDKAKERLLDTLPKPTDLVLEVPKKTHTQRQEYSYKIQRTFSVQTDCLKYASCISIICTPDETRRVMRGLQNEFYSLAKVRNFRVRPAVIYFIPEMLGSDGIILPSIKPRKVRRLSTNLWNLENIGAYEAQKQSTGAGINIAVLDTGVDYRHQELNKNYCGGWNFVNSNDDPFDGNGHGTHCSGTAVGTRTGISIDSNLYAGKVLSDEGYGSEVLINQGIEWCMDNKIHVISMSLGSAYSTSTGAEICKKAAQMGILICAAAGNEGYGRSYPASYPGVISVAAVDKDNNHAEFSNICDTLDISAPGVDIVSAWPGNAYNEISGTSMATPHVAGVCALASSYFSSTNNIEAQMKKTADNLGDEVEFGYGLVRADNLVNNASKMRRSKNGRTYARKYSGKYAGARV